MKKIFFLLTIFLLSACKTVPLTGRKQLNLIPSEQINSLSYDQYRQTLSDAQVVKGTEWANWVETVGNDIRRAVETYLRQEGKSDLIEGYAWDFNLIKDDNTVNAWCMPGGKVAFYTGIMPVCEDKEGVAVVMGHEVAHAIARHGNERMSQGLVQQLGGVGLSIAIQDKPAETQALFLGAYGVASQVGVLLPFSRTHESEADHLGLIFMAMAGYDPQAAPAFWQRMEAQGSGNQPPEFLSTHPSHSTRIKNLNKWMPEAEKYYKGNE